MSNQSYTKGCRDCGQQIRMAVQEVNGKWAAYEIFEMIDIRLKRVEKMLFNGGK